MTGSKRLDCNDLLNAAIVELHCALQTANFEPNIQSARKSLFILACRMKAEKPNALEELRNCPLVQKGRIKIERVDENVGRNSKTNTETV